MLQSGAAPLAHAIAACRIRRHHRQGAEPIEEVHAVVDHVVTALSAASAGALLSSSFFASSALARLRR